MGKFYNFVSTILILLLIPSSDCMDTQSEWNELDPEEVRHVSDVENTLYFVILDLSVVYCV